MRHSQLAKKYSAPSDRASMGPYAGLAEPDAPRRRRASRSRSRAEVDVALHTIGLALESLLDDTRLPDGPDAAATLPVPARDVRGLLLRELFADTEVDAHDISVIVDGDRVTLVGTVCSPLSRLLVEDLAWSLPNIGACDNRLALR